MIPSAAAPHSTASICKTVGVLTRLWRFPGVRRGRCALIESTGFSQYGQEVGDRRAVFEHHAPGGGGAGGHRQRRASRRGPLVATDGRGVADELGSDFDDGSLPGENGHDLSTPYQTGDAVPG